MNYKEIKQWALDNTDYLFGDETEIKFEKVKWVKCRKIHECVCCMREIEVGEEALLDTWVEEGSQTIDRRYTCSACIKKAMEECLP
jgi:hypothetical protein